VNGNLIFPEVLFILIKKNQTNKKLTRTLRKINLTGCSILSDLKHHVCRFVNLYVTVLIPKKMKEEMQALKIYFYIHVNCFQNHVKFCCFISKDL